MWLQIVFILSIIISSGKALISRCLENQQMVIGIDGGPSSRTAELIRNLKTVNIPFVFHIDSEKLGEEWVTILMKEMIQSENILGIYLNESLDINNMSSEGLRGTIENRMNLFVDACGKNPIFIRVPMGTSEKAIKDLEYAGFLVTSANLRIESETCELTFNSTVLNYDSRAVSVIMSIADNSKSCNSSEVTNILRYSKMLGYNITSLNECIGLKDPYKSSKNLTTVDFNLSDEKTPSEVSILSSSITLLANEQPGLLNCCRLSLAISFLVFSVLIL